MSDNGGLQEVLSASADVPNALFMISWIIMTDCVTNEKRCSSTTYVAFQLFSFPHLHPSIILQQFPFWRTSCLLQKAEVEWRNKERSTFILMDTCVQKCFYLLPLWPFEGSKCSFSYGCKAIITMNEVETHFSCKNWSTILEFWKKTTDLLRSM